MAGVKGMAGALIERALGNERSGLGKLVDRPQIPHQKQLSGLEENRWTDRQRDKDRQTRETIFIRENFNSA